MKKLNHILVQLFFCGTSLVFSFPAQAKSPARIWNDMILQAIRYDYARPTVSARNLYHYSIALHDSWAIYDTSTNNFYINFKQSSPNIERDREITTSFAAYRILLARFAKAPKVEAITSQATELMKELDLDYEFITTDESPAGRGNLIAQMILSNFAYDGALEDKDYETPPQHWAPLNPPLLVKFLGAGQILNLNFWQPLALDFSIDQGGFPLPNNVQIPLTLHWGSLSPFALTANDKNARTGLYLDPGPLVQFAGEGHDDFRSALEEVIEFSSWLDPQDRVQMDISPANLGNNQLGSNSGTGHAFNPITKAPYESNLSYRGDYARALAEFWADGPHSETPPGHWNVMANNACESPHFKRRWMGQGPELSSHEWDVKMYLTLNGALYDASIAAWGAKGYYQSSRPISAIRHMGSLGQSSDPNLPSYHPHGFKLREGLIEVITEELTQPGEKFAHLVGAEGRIAVRSWKGAPKNSSQNLGVDWILAEAWLPYQKDTFVTPPFPGYVSGHSTYSRAAAEVLTSLTGSKYFPGGMGEYVIPAHTGLTFEHGPERTLKLQWATYYDAADQSARSRIFGGIHASFDDIPGRRMGSIIGKRAVFRVNTLYK